MNLIVDPSMAALGSDSARNFNVLRFEFSVSGCFSWQPLIMSESEDSLRTVSSSLFVLSVSEKYILSEFEVLSALFIVSV